VAGLDDRVKAAAPIYGCGWNTLVFPTQTAADPIDEGVKRWRNLLSSESYAPLVRCPILFLNATNDFHGNMDRSFATLALVPAGEKRQIYTPRYNHHIEPAEGKDLPLWMAWHLKGEGGPWPRTPQVSLVGQGVNPGIRVVPDQPQSVKQVQLYYALNTPWPQSRFWRSAPVSGFEGGVYTAEAPFFAADDVIFAFANVAYTSGVRLSSSLVRVAARDLPGAKPTLVWEPLIDDMHDGEAWRFGPAYTDPLLDAGYLMTWQGSNGERGLTLDPALWGGTFDIGTHKIGDPQWRGRGRDVLLIDCDASRPMKELRVKVIRRDWQPTREEFTMPVELPDGGTTNSRPNWKTICIAPERLRDAKGNRLGDWHEVDCFTLTGAARTSRPPVFRNLRWDVEGPSR
jgi:hypothetical protein